MFLASLLLFSFTYLLATKLKRFRGASFFPASTRAIVADFAVILALVCATIADWILQVDTPKLKVVRNVFIDILLKKTYCTIVSAGA